MGGRKSARIRGPTAGVTLELRLALFAMKVRGVTEECLSIRRRWHCQPWASTTSRACLPPCGGWRTRKLGGSVRIDTVRVSCPTNNERYERIYVYTAQLSNRSLRNSRNYSNNYMKIVLVQVLLHEAQ